MPPTNCPFAFAAARAASTVAVAPNTMAPAQVPDRTTADELQERARRACCSGKRFLAATLAGAALGALVAYAAYSAAGGQGVGAALAGLGAELAIVPLIVCGTGRALGGEGLLACTYLPGLCTLAGASMLDEARLALALGMVLLPITSSLVFEVSFLIDRAWRPLLSRRKHSRLAGLKEWTWAS